MPAFDADLAYFKSGEADNLAFGQNGLICTTNTTPVTGVKIACFQFVEDTVFTTLTAAADYSVTGTLTGITFKAGATLFGRFSAYTLTSGKVIAYKYAD